MGLEVKVRTLEHILHELEGFGVDPFELPYPIDAPVIGTVKTPTDLVRKLVEVERMGKLSEVVESLVNHTLNRDEDIYEEEGCSLPEELRNLYEDFKRMVVFYFKTLDPNTRELILSRGKPRLKLYSPNECILKVFLEYDGENIPYILYLHQEQDSIRKKAKLLVEDLESIAKGEFFRF